MTAIAYQPVTQPHLRMTARGRRVLLALAATPLVIAALVMALNGGMATATDSSAPVQYVTVQSGQSLWSLAQQIAPHADPRDVVADIASYNGLADSSVQVGERLAVPSKYVP